MVQLSPYLSDAQIAEICDPLIQPGAQYKHLVKLGLHVARKPSGKPLVARSEFERVLGAARLFANNDTAGAGDLGALRQRWANKNGAQAQRR